MDKETACKATDILFEIKEVEATLYVLEHAKANNEKNTFRSKHERISYTY